MWVQLRLLVVQTVLTLYVAASSFIKMSNFEEQNDFANPWKGPLQFCLAEICGAPL